VYIEPGSPWENGYCESFNSKLRVDSCSDGSLCSRHRVDIAVHIHAEVSECWSRRGAHCHRRNNRRLPGGRIVGLHAALPTAKIHHLSVHNLERIGCCRVIVRVVARIQRGRVLRPLFNGGKHYTNSTRKTWRSPRYDEIRAVGLRSIAPIKDGGGGVSIVWSRAISIALKEIRLSFAFGCRIFQMFFGDVDFRKLGTRSPGPGQTTQFDVRQDWLSRAPVIQ